MSNPSGRVYNAAFKFGGYINMNEENNLLFSIGTNLRNNDDDSVVVSADNLN